MHLMYFTEQPMSTYPADKGLEFGATALMFSNRYFDPVDGSRLYNEFLEQYLYAEEVGIDGIMLNEHHNAPFCMQAKANIFAAILAGMTEKVKIVMLGNPLPLAENPVRLAEELAMIDMISKGRLVSGFVRGGGQEQLAAGVNPAYNRERFEEAHDLVVRAWTETGPFRFEGRHYQNRVVNPWAVPYQKPHPPIWVPGTSSRETVEWCARHRYPYVMLSTQLELTREMYKVYYETAEEEGYEAGPQHLGYMFFVHVEETKAKAMEVGRTLTQGVRSPFDPGVQRPIPWIMSPPGLNSRRAVALRRQMVAPDATGKTRAGALASFEDQVATRGMIVGTPDECVEGIRYIMEYLRPGIIIFRTGDGAMDHESQMRTLKLMGEEVLPAMRDIARELGLPGPYEVDPATNESLAALAP